MIKLAPETFLVKGKLTIPGEDGEPLVIEFAGRYKRLLRSERERLDKQLNKRAFEALPADRRTPYMTEQLEGPLKKVKPFGTDAEFLDLLLVGWQLKDAAGEPIEFNPEHRAEVFEQVDGLESAFVGAYFEGRRNQDISKN